MVQLPPLKIIFVNFAETRKININRLNYINSREKKYTKTDKKIIITKITSLPRIYTSGPPCTNCEVRRHLEVVKLRLNVDKMVT